MMMLIIEMMFWKWIETGKMIRPVFGQAHKIKTIIMLAIIITKAFPWKSPVINNIVWIRHSHIFIFRLMGVSKRTGLKR